MNKIGFFEEKGSLLLDMVNLFDASVTTSYMLTLKPIAATVLAIFLFWRVIQIMMGSNTKPIADVLIEVLVWAIVWAFAFNGGGYLDMVQKGMNEVFAWSGGGKGFFRNLDTWYESLVRASEIFYAKDHSEYVKFQGVVAQIIIIFGSIILAIIPFFIIIASNMLMEIIIMLAPFLILSLIFPALKTMFYNGLGLFLRVTLTMLIISIIQKSFQSKINKFVVESAKSASTSSDFTIIGSAILILVMCAIYGGLLYSAVPIAKVISGSISNINIGTKKSYKSL